jgi:DNA-binding transcriptional regulator GbsR (MarR family)
MFFKRLFNKGNRKHFFRVSIEFIETLVKVWEKLDRNSVEPLALQKIIVKNCQLKYNYQ